MVGFLSNDWRSSENKSITLISDFYSRRLGRAIDSRAMGCASISGRSKLSFKPNDLESFL
jgi:uncharacterized heparinase superfamily protein